MSKIMIVDDFELSLDLLRTVLAVNGYEVMTAANGAEALEKARADTPILLITEITMPVMDGYSLAREWMKDARLKHVPLVFYTSTDIDPSDRAFALSLGVARFVTKLAEPERVLEQVRELLADQQAGRLEPPEPAPMEEAAFLGQYHATLVRKLKRGLGTHEMRALARKIETRRQVEAALRLQATIAENMFGGVILVRASDGVIVYVNGTLAEMFGYAPDEVIGNNVAMLHAATETGQEATTDNIEDSLEKRGYWSGDVRNVRKNGTCFWSSSIRTAFDHPEHGTMWMGTLTGITERE